MSEKVEILTENQAVKNLDFPIEIKVYEGGTQIIPSSATITIKDPGGEEKIEDADMSIDENGTMTYTLDKEYTDTLWEDALIEVEYVYDSSTFRSVFIFDVVLNILKCSVIDADLRKYHPQLEDEIWEDEQSNYDDQIQEAFRLVKRDVKNKGKRPAMIIDGMQIRELIILKTFELVFFDFSKDESDIWFVRYKDVRDRYESARDALVIHYDIDESGILEEDERGRSLGQIDLER